SLGDKTHFGRSETPYVVSYGLIHQHRRQFGVPPSGGPARLKPELQTSINQNQDSGILRRLHHVLKLPISRDRRFQLSGSGIIFQKPFYFLSQKFNRLLPPASI